MISDCAQSLIDLVKATPGDLFGTTTKRVGLAVGGNSVDPLMVNVPVPAAWIIFTSDENVSTTSRVMCGPMVKFNFVIKIIMKYTTEADIIANQYTILDAVRDTVHAATGPKGNQWKYEGQVLEELTDRMVFEQRYSLTVAA